MFSNLCQRRQTVCDQFGALARQALARGEPVKRPATVALSMDVDAFFEALASALERANDVSPVNA